MDKRKRIPTRNPNWMFIFQNGFSLCLFSYLIFVGGKGDKIADSFEVVQINIILFSCLIIGLLLYSLVVGKKFISPECIEYTQLFLGVTLFSVIFSDNFWQSLNEFYLWTLYYLLFLGVSNLIYLGWNKAHIFYNLLFIGGVINLFKIVQAGLWISKWNTFGNGLLESLLAYRGNSPNLSAAFANMILMISLALIFDKKRKLNILILFLIVSSIIVVILSSSRGGLIAMVVGMGVLLFTAVIKNRRINFGILKNNSRTIIGIISGFALVAAGVLYLIFMTSRPGLSARFDFWKIGFQAFKDNPLFGSGLYTMGNNLYDIRVTSSGSLHTHAHSIYFNLLGELGILGFSAFLLLIGSVVKKLSISFFGGSYLALGALGALGSFLAHGLFDTLYVEPHISMGLIIICSGGLPIRSQNFIKHNRISKSAPIWTSLIALSLGWILLFQRVPFQNAIINSNNYARDKAYEDFGTAIIRKPEFSLTYQQRAITASFLEMENIQQAQEYRKSAIRDFEKAIELDSTWATNYANLGVLYAADGNYKLALKTMERAQYLAPNSSLITLNLAIIAENANALELARNAYWEYLHKEDVLDAGPFWAETNLRQAIYSGWKFHKSLEYETEKTEKDYLDLMEQGKQNIGLHLRLAEYYWDHGRYQLALDELDIVEMGGKGSGVAFDLLWLKANIEIKKGNYEIGLEFAQTAIDGWRYQSIDGPGSYGNSLYGERLFRYPSINDDLVPQFEIAPIPQTWINRMVIVGRWYSEINATEEAINILLEVISIDSNNEEASVLLEELGANNNHDE